MLDFYAHYAYNIKCKGVMYTMPLTGKELAKIAK